MIPSLSGAVANLSASDPYWSSVTCMIQFYTESKDYKNNHTITLNGGAALSTSIVKFGTKALDCTTATMWASISGDSTEDFNPRAQDFTYEAWMYFTGTLTVSWKIWGDDAAIVDYLNVIVDTTHAHIVWHPNGDVVEFNPSVVLPSGSWHHIAHTRSGNTQYIFIDGIQQTSRENSSNVGAASVGWGLFGDFSVRITTGYIDSFRVTKGVARYTGDFSVPTAAFPRR